MITKTTSNLKALQCGFSEMIESTKTADEAKRATKLGIIAEHLRDLNTDIADAVALVQSMYETCEDAGCKVLFRQLMANTEVHAISVTNQLSSSFFDTPTQRVANISIEEYGLPGAQEAHIVCQFVDSQSNTALHFAPAGDKFYVKAVYPGSPVRAVADGVPQCEYLDDFCDQLSKSKLASGPATEVAMLVQAFADSFDHWRDLLAERVTNVIKSGNDYAKSTFEGSVLEQAHESFKDIMDAPVALD